MTAALGSDEAPKPRPLLMLSMFASDRDVDWESGEPRVNVPEVNCGDRVRNCLYC